MNPLAGQPPVVPSLPPFHPRHSTLPSNPVPTITFTANLQRHVRVPSRAVQALTVCEALERVFAEVPQARSYVVDEHGALRTHMNIYVGGEPIRDRKTLQDVVAENAEIYVMQALSGG